MKISPDVYFAIVIAHTGHPWEHECVVLIRKQRSWLESR